MFAPSLVPQGYSGNNAQTVVKNTVLFNCMRRFCFAVNKTAIEDLPGVDLCGWSQVHHAAYCDNCLVL